MCKSTLFENFITPIAHEELSTYFHDIKNGKYQEEIEKIRTLIEQGNVEDAEKCKRKLLAFTPSGRFKNGRTKENLIEYSGCIALDFDKIQNNKINSLFESIISNPYTLCCFRSPSGNGLKVFVEINTDLIHHEVAYKQVQKHYEAILGIQADEKCKDVTRLCFMSYDPNAFWNIQNENFTVTLPDELELPFTQTQTSKSSVDSQIILEPKQYINSFLFDQQVDFTEQNIQYTNGNRNNFIYQLVSNCNRAGLKQSDTELLCIQRFDLPEIEIKAIIKNVYINLKHEFAKFANTAKLQSSEQQKQNGDYLKATPSIPEELYMKMPQILQHGAMAFSDRRERDVFLTGALAILSGCLPRVKGVYDGNEVFPNIFSFIIAPAASGKGVLKFSKMLADEYHSHILKESQEAESKYNQELSEHKQKINNKKKGDTSTEKVPTKPPFKVVYIPANTSYAKILWHLEQNEGTGIICETEADTLGNVFKQEWGSYSDMLRKSFHHERLSSSRKGNNEFTEVNAPTLSIALSGTPNQVTGLIASSEDGLFSRFMFYAFKVEQKWKDVSPNAKNINLTEHFKTLSLSVYKMVLFLQQEETIIELTNQQWQQLNQTCDKWLNEATMFTAEEAASIVKRLGLILYRIAMQFTALRKFENSEAAVTLVCTDEDLTTALLLAEIYLQHSLLMFNNLPKHSEAISFKAGDSKRKFFDALPAKFTRKQAVEIGQQFQFSPRTVDEILHKTIGMALEKQKAGHYLKI